jgi:cell division septum initiation protein DivIVA
MKHVHGSIEGVDQLRFMARTALEEVAKRAKDLEQKVLEEAQKMSVDELYRRATPRTTAPPSGAAGSQR